MKLLVLESGAKSEGSRHLNTQVDLQIWGNHVKALNEIYNSQRSQFADILHFWREQVYAQNISRGYFNPWS